MGPASWLGPWADLDAHHLAIEFVRRFPKLAQATFHPTSHMPGWYGTLLAHCEYGYMPYLFSEYEPQSDALRMWCVIEGSQSTHRMVPVLSNDQRRSRTGTSANAPMDESRVKRG